MARMTTKRQVTAVITAALNEALDGDIVSVPDLAEAVIAGLLDQFTIQAKRPRGSMQGDAGPCCCVCVIPCASGTCRYPLADDDRT